jgi:hypothetical protein
MESWKSAMEITPDQWRRRFQHEALLTFGDGDLLGAGFCGQGGCHGPCRPHPDRLGYFLKQSMLIEVQATYFVLKRWNQNPAATKRQIGIWQHWTEETEDNHRQNAPTSYFEIFAEDKPDR